MPLLRTDTGWRWRKTLVSMTTTRLRRSRGLGGGEKLFQILLVFMESPRALKIEVFVAWFGARDRRRPGALHTRMNEDGSSHLPCSYWNLTLLSTTIWPSSLMLMPQRSSGRGAGPSKLMPLI